jgi:hypothetical protein
MVPRGREAGHHHLPIAAGQGQVVGLVFTRDGFG